MQCGADALQFGAMRCRVIAVAEVTAGDPLRDRVQGPKGELSGSSGQRAEQSSITVQICISHQVGTRSSELGFVWGNLRAWTILSHRSVVSSVSRDLENSRRTYGLRRTPNSDRGSFSLSPGTWEKYPTAGFIPR